MMKIIVGFGPTYKLLKNVMRLLKVQLLLKAMFYLHF